MSRIKTLMALSIALLVLAVAGCQRKELLDPHDHHNLYIKAHFDSLALTQLLSHKSDGYTNPGEPKSTSYILYERNTQKVAYRGDFKGLEGGMYVQEGIYDLLVYTSDFNEYDANFYRNTGIKENAETYTRQTPIDQQARTDVTEMYMVEPDPTFSALVEDIVVFQGQEDKFLEVEFVQKSFKYYLTIKARGLQNIHTATMYISGMYTTAFLTNDDHRMNEAGTQTLDMQIFRSKPTSAEEIGKGQLYGEFWSFGPNQNDEIVNTITLQFVNGDVITKRLKDLTSQIKTLTRGGEIIVEEIVEIKGPPGGFQPGVDDWGDHQDVEIIL
jgi:hypothetical protein